MKTEYEVRFLDIDETAFVEKLKSAGAVFIADWFQIRNIYNMIPHRHNHWIRLRTNGESTTLAVKEIHGDTVDGTQELEVTVSSFDDTAAILAKMGYLPRGRQESRRKRWILDNVEIDIDTWPLIPTYVELEAENESDIKRVAKKLGLDYEKACTMGVLDMAHKIYHLTDDQLNFTQFPR
jgi:adenylate cyclase class 2